MFSPLSWNALQFIALLLWGNKQNKTYDSLEIWNLFLLLNKISHRFAHSWVLLILNFML